MASADARGAAEAMQACDAAKTPVTIITGFLGAGKTTLLNYILKARNERNISVIENEFGEVNIDNELVADNLIEKEDLVSLDNGCVCCSLRKDVVKALAEIERRGRHRNKRVDQVILETTGLADPAPVAFTFFANPWIASRFRLDSIVCVCDTRYVLEHLEAIGGADEPGAINEAAQQLAFADLILLNKTDLVSEDQLARVRAVVRGINQNARQIECRLNQEGGQPPLGVLLDSNAFSVHKALKVDPYFLDSDSGSECGDEDTDSDEEATAEGGAGAAGDTPRAAAAAAAKAAGVGAGTAADTGPGTTHDGGAAPPGGKAAGAGACAAAAGAEDETESDATHLQLQPPAAAAATADADAHAGRKRAAPAAACASGSDAGPAAAVEPAQQQQQQHERRPKRRRKHMHDVAGIGSVGIVARGPLDEYRFNMFMRDLLTEKAKDIFRCKGVLAVHGYGNRKFVFQGVHETICYGPGERPWGEDEPRINQIVFIGRGLNRKSLMMGFKTCVWQPLPDGWREAFDPVTNQPYYYNPTTHEKTWARPQQAGRRAPAADAVTVTPVVPTQQPRSLQPGRRRAGGNGGGANGGRDEGGAASCASGAEPAQRGGGSGGAGEQRSTSAGGAALSDTL